MILLSILIPSIPERIDQLKAVIEKYQSYIDKYDLNNGVQIISFIDNKKITIGEKRNMLVSMAAGKYWVMSDEDDQLTEMYFQYFKCLLGKDVDVITYLQSAQINDDKSTVEFGLNNVNEDLIPNGITKRMAWHCCTWRKEAVKEARFAPINWGEDDLFARTANELAKTSYHFPEVCHIYRHDSTKTAAFQ
jgi:glycosyltransferase involved in cell wall biosynthesis